MAMSRAQQAAMPRRTPTEIAEEAYQAARAVRRYADATGPAGIPIPDPRTAWRVTSDGKLMARIVRAAFADYRASILSPERERALVELLGAELEKAFPPSDMMVLRQYDFASVVGRTFVDLGRYGHQTFELVEPMLLPKGKGSFHTGEGPGLPLPEGALSYFDDRAAVEDVKAPDFMNAIHWPGQQKAREGRWPFWREIEAAWPRVAAWMAAQRAACR